MKEVIQIYNISWENVPREEWEHLLSELSIGSYVAELPYKVPYDFPTWKIPLPMKVSAMSIDAPMDITMPSVMEFCREVVESQRLGRSEAWRKIS